MNRPSSIVLFADPLGVAVVAVACVAPRSLVVIRVGSGERVSLPLFAAAPSVARIALQYLAAPRCIVALAHGAVALIRVAIATDSGALQLSIDGQLTSTALGNVWPLAAVLDGGLLSLCTMQAAVLRLASSALPPTSVRCSEPSLLCCAAFAPSSVGAAAVAGGSTFGDIVVWRAADGAVLQRCQGHAGAVRCIVWSEDALLLLSASEDRSVRVWRRESTARAFTCTSVLFGHDGRVWSCSLFPSGDAFCTGGEDGVVRQWSLVAAPVCVCADACHASDVWQVASCVAGGALTLASVSRDGSVRLARAGTTPTVCDNVLRDAVLRVDAALRVSAVHVCATTGALFVGFACGRVARLSLDMALAPLAELDGRGVSCLSACDAGLLVGTNSGDVALLDLRSGAVVRVAGAHRDRVRFASGHALSSGSLLVVSSAQGDGVALTTLGDAGASTLRVRIDGASSNAKFGATCAFSVAVVESHACAVAGDSSGNVHLFGVPAARTASSAPWAAAMVALGDASVSVRGVHQGERVTAMRVRATTSDGVVLTTLGRDGCAVEVRFALDESRAIVGTLLRRSRVLAGILPPSNRLRCERWTGGVMAVLHGRTFAAVAERAGGFVLAGSMPETPSLGVVYDCAVVGDTLWALHATSADSLRVAAAKVAPPLLPPTHSQYVDAAHYMPGLELAATGGEDTHVWLWDARTHDAVLELHAHNGSVFCFASADDGTLLSGGARGAVVEHKLWRTADGVLLAEQRNAATWSALAELLGGDCRVISLACWRAADLLRVCVGTADGRVVLLDATPPPPLQTAVASLGCAVFSLARAGEHVLAGAADGGIRAIDAHTGAVVARLVHGHQSGVTALCVAGRRVVSVGDDQALVVADYDAAWGCVRVARVALAHGAAVRGVEFCDATLVTASADERVAVWRVGDELVIERLSVQLSGVEETSAMALCGGAQVLVVGNGASFISFAPA